MEPILDPVHDTHLIIQLVHNAQADFDYLMSKEPHNLASASSAYRKRRGQHPPLGFNKWYMYIGENNAIVEIICIQDYKAISKSEFP